MLVGARIPIARTRSDMLPTSHRYCEPGRTSYPQRSSHSGWKQDAFMELDA